MELSREIYLTRRFSKHHRAQFVVILQLGRHSAGFRLNRLFSPQSGGLVGVNVRVPEKTMLLHSVFSTSYNDSWADSLSAKPTKKL